LEGLSLSNNQITDITPLVGLTNLTSLSLHDAQITDLTQLAGFTNLTILGLGGNQITDITPLAGLTNLSTLLLHNNLIRDWSPVAHVEIVSRGNQRTSSITLPNRRVTDAERREWIDDYWAFGGPTAVELEVVRLVNIERANHGLSRVEIDDTLMMAARFFAQQAHDLREYASIGWGSTSSQARSHNFGPYADRPGQGRYPWGASYNVARAFGANVRSGGNWFSGGSMSAESLVNGWMNSYGHRRLILSPEHRFIGMGQFPGGISYLFLSERASN
jgi:Leucine-rich repeat (LRR) protein